jgi:hypothetical protein
VPSLGRLRELSGKDRYESGPVDTVRRMIQSGELPAGLTCALSRAPTDDLLMFEVLVPRYYKNPAARDNAGLLALGLTFGWVGFLFHGLLSPPKFNEEGAIRVRVPLRVAARYHSKVRGMSRARLKRLLRTVPVYARLLDESPFARVTVEERGTA